MWRYLGLRLIEIVPVILAVASVSFLLIQFIPGSAAESILGQRATPEAVEELNRQLGLDRPVILQYLDSMGALLRGDFGTSLISGAPVLELVWNRLPVTIALAILTTLVSAVIGVLIGVVAATRGGTTDRILTAGSGLGLAIPNFWLGIVAVLVFAIWLRWLPATGYVDFFEDPGEWVMHLVLPVAVLAVLQIAAIARQTRSALLIEFRRDYIRALRASGINRTRIIWRHALRNASGPVITTLGLQFVGVLGGSVIIEQVFALRGIGSLMVESANVRDIPLLQAIVILSAVIVLLVNLVVDFFSFLLNPKVRPA